MLAMEMRSLGASGMQVSRLCFGTLTMGPMQRGFSPERGAALLTYAYARGFRFLDTADIYDTYPHIRLALQKCAYRVSTKAYCWDKATASAALERAFFGLDREYVDVFMLHEQESIHTLRGHREALDYLNEQKAKGRIGLVGVSTHYAGCVRAAAFFGGVDVIHPLINVEGIGIQDGTRADMEAAIAYAHSLGVGIFAMKPLGGGHLIADNARALRYLLDAPWADSIAVGMQSEKEIDANAAMAGGDESAMWELSHRERHLIVQDYCEGCGKCVEFCRAGALSIRDGHAVVDEDKCVLCGYCARVCPQFAVKVI